MTLTSFVRTARMLGPHAWKILHTAGSYYVWFVFAKSYGLRAATMPEYIGEQRCWSLVLGLRILAAVVRPRAQAAPVRQ